MGDDTAAGDRETTVRDYYRALDEHAYEALDEVLAPEFVHDRPDRTFGGREAFVQFVRDERPMKDTTHQIDATYDNEEGVVAHGRLLDADGTRLFQFVDIFEFAGARATKVTTFARER
jgi:ketosteroid isomerase-like protein